MDESAMRQLPLAVRLRTLRTARGLTQAQLAERAGVTRQSIVNWEGARKVPYRRHRVWLAQALDVSLDDLTPDAKGPR